MEDTLGEKLLLVQKEKVFIVLILVLMEDTLGAVHKVMQIANNFVLILVLMEDTLGDQNLRILYFRGFDNNKTYQLSFC